MLTGKLSVVETAATAGNDLHAAIGTELIFGTAEETTWLTGKGSVVETAGNVLDVGAGDESKEIEETGESSVEETGDETCDAGPEDEKVNGKTEVTVV